MSHTNVRGRWARSGLLASVFAVLVSFVVWGSAGASTSPAWTGTFTNFHTSTWDSQWGMTSDTAQCAGASGSFGCNWGYSNLQPVADSTAPGGARR